MPVVLRPVQNSDAQNIANVMKSNPKQTKSAKAAKATKGASKKKKAAQSHSGFDISENVPDPQTTRRVSFREQPRSPLGRIPLEMIDKGANVAGGAPTPEVIPDAKRRQRPLDLSPVPMVEPDKTKETKQRNKDEVPAGAVARAAMLASSTAARMAARRRERQDLRSTQHRDEKETGGLGAPKIGLDSELKRMQHEREDRVARLFAQLDRLGAGVSMKPLSTARESHAIVPYQGAPLVHGFAAPALLTLCSRKESRQWLREYLIREGRVQEIRTLVEGAPVELQQTLVSVLTRLLTEEEKDEDVLITLIGAESRQNKMIVKDDDRPLPRPVDLF